MTTHPALCICAVCATRRETAAREEIAQLKALVAELLAALQTWTDSKEDPALDDLVARARKAA